MRDRAESDELEERADERVRDECNGSYRENPSCRSARGFEHEQNAERAECEVDRAGCCSAVRERSDVGERPAEGGDGRHDEKHVDCRRACGRCVATRRVEHERQSQRDEEKARAVRERLDDGEDPVQRVQRKPRCDDCCRARHRAHAYVVHTPRSR
jgi:hypothetical protein